ncbi:MAG TPA: hypothetical protein VHE77_06895 [Dongiaceae bacterium]|nr:hypothetical protein [Dongiaceae bacterium]
MRGITRAVLLGAAMAAGAIGIAQAKENQEYTLGQWTGYSYTDDNNGQFTDCTAWASNDDNVQLGVSVTKEYQLQFYLYSKSWNLPQDQSYPVSYWVDRGGQYRGKVVTSGKSTVYIDVDSDNDVFQALKAGTELTVRTSSDDYVFNLANSGNALSRLVDCVDQHAKAATTNPFGPGSGGDQGNSSQQQDTNQNNQQQNDSQQSNNQQSNGSDDTAMKQLDVSVDDVQKFLVDVTGAKPSMIKVAAKTDKAGAQYFDFSTPLGGGQFWQEKLGSDQLEDIAAGYVASYRKDCKGDFEESPAKPVQSQKGQLSAGTAACSVSPYQNNGPEFLSYAMAEDQGVISIYVTYTGGNAAKAKSDSLGRLIERRYEDMLQEQN